MATAMSARTDDLDAATPPRRRWPVYLAVGLVLVLAGVVGYVLWFTAVLGVRTVSVAGAGAGLTTEVRAVLEVPDGTPLIRVDLAAVQRQVEAVPEVASAQVRRDWPNGLRVTVVARTPVAVTSANGALWLLDSAGYPYLKVPAAPAGLTTVELATPGAGDPATTAALAVVGSMTAEFRATVAAVRAPSVFGIEVLLKDGRTVVWGGSDEGARKMQILPALLRQPGKIYDISDPAIVTVRSDR